MYEIPAGPCREHGMFSTCTTCICPEQKPLKGATDPYRVSTGSVPITYIRSLALYHILIHGASKYDMHSLSILFNTNLA